MNDSKSSDSGMDWSPEKGYSLEDSKRHKHGAPRPALGSIRIFFILVVYRFKKK